MAGALSLPLQKAQNKVMCPTHSFTFMGTLENTGKPFPH